MEAVEQRWPVSDLTLKVLDLDAETAFYREFGLAPLERTGSEAVLGAGDRPLLRLRALREGRPRPPRTAGLYHFAILVPDEGALGSFLVHVAGMKVAFVGASDHLVSQALYFEDPEGNGIEVYADRPRSAWGWSGGQVKMATLPLDLQRLAGLASGTWNGFPPGTLLGHMHLNVADLDRSQAHYERMGMEVIAALPGARFLSWDGYHHHLGMNLWAGRRVAPVEPDVAGLESFTIARPSPSAGEPDPDGVRVDVAPGVAARAG